MRIKYVIGDIMDSVEKAMQEYERKEEEKRLAFLKKGANKIRDDDDLLYRLMALHLSQRFKIGLNWNNEPHNVVYTILNYYIDNIDEPWEKWLNKNNAPIIRPIKEIKKYFPELKEISNDEREIIKIANNLYGLDIKTDYDDFDTNHFFYAYELDFNSFTPINIIKRVKELKTEKGILAKYGYDTSKIDEELKKFGLTEEQIEVL